MKRLNSFFIFGLLVFSLPSNTFAGVCGGGDRNTSDSGKVGMANPAAVYCSELGYKYKIVDTPKGQQGLCIFPDDTQCDEWDFLIGRCGQEYSYCACNGYDIITLKDGKNPFSKEYAVCVDRKWKETEGGDNENSKIIGSVTDLMDLNEMVIKAIDFSENYAVLEDLQRVPLTLDPVPSSFDWRDYQGQNWMTEVKNQGICGSCWAFAAVATAEARYNIQMNNPDIDLDLSEQYLVSDCFLGWGGTCCGGMSREALEYMRDYGIPDDVCMTYVDGEGCSCNGGTCNLNCDHRGIFCSDTECSDRCTDWEDRLIKILAVISYYQPSRQTIKEYIANKGPVTVAMGVGTQFGGDWDEDNIYRCSDDTGTNHAVVLVGYNDAGEYWIVRDSTGISHDGYGYFKVGYGECKIEDYFLEVLAVKDSDKDGIPNPDDNCPYRYNPDQSNSDGDSHGDVCDNCPLIPNEDQKDDDDDGIGNLCDDCPNDPDNDMDGDDVCGDIDNCPVDYNPDQLNSDTDSYGDVCDNCPLERNIHQYDTDHDGVGNDCDNCFMEYNPDQADNDSDEVGDACDEDDDNDDILDVNDNCPKKPNGPNGGTCTEGTDSGDPCTIAGDNESECGIDGFCSMDQENGDGDETGDACDDCPNDPDNDIDEDDVCGDIDNCPVDYNPGQDDGDTDGIGNVCDDCPNDPDNDIDEDDVCGNIDNCPVDYNPGQDDGDTDGIGNVCDNCPADANPNQKNTDKENEVLPNYPPGDGLGDACDDDDDNDGLSDDEEDIFGTDPLDLDTDDDNLWDSDEVSRGTDPNIPDYFLNTLGSDVSGEGDGSLSAPWRTVQHAIGEVTSSSSNQVILNVAAGEYKENIELEKEEVLFKGSLKGCWDNDFTERDCFTYESILDGGGFGRVIYVPSDASGVTIDGFTIQNGDGENGGGIYVAENTSVTIANNIIQNNSALKNGGGIYINNNASLIISKNVIRSNHATYDDNGNGGGIYVADNCDGSLSNNIISENAVSWTGGGIYIGDDSPITVINNTIAGNSGIFGVGIIVAASNPIIKNTIIWEENGNDLFGVNCDMISFSIVEDEYCSIPRNDPSFLGGGNYHLTGTSPCIDAGTSDGAPEADMDGNQRYDVPDVPNTGGGDLPYYDMGAYEYIITTCYITVISPQSGQDWEIGSTRTIEWTSSGAGDMVKIELGQPAGCWGYNWSTIISSTSNDESYNWTVQGAVQSNCKIRICSLEHPDCCGESALFDIVGNRPPSEPTITFSKNPIEPGELLQFCTYSIDPDGDAITYHWKIIDPNDGVNEFDTDQECTSDTLSTPGSYTFYCTAEDEYGAKSGTAVAKLIVGTITVTSPEAGVDWEIGSTYTIEWTSSGVDGDVKIEVSRPSACGRLWSHIAAVPVSDGSYPWPVEEPAKNNCIVRITSIDNPDIYGESGPFDIVEPPLSP